VIETTLKILQINVENDKFRLIFSNQETGELSFSNPLFKSFNMKFSVLKTQLAIRHCGRSILWPDGKEIDADTLYEHSFKYM
jgi:hypothetical protein